MTASPDDAAASPTPPRAGGGPAAPSFSGTTGPRIPEDPMSHHPTAHDETVRMRGDGPDGRPPLDAGRPASDGSRPEQDRFDDTRPVTRDWLLGAPDGAREPAPARPAPAAAPAAAPSS